MKKGSEHEVIIREYEFPNKGIAYMEGDHKGSICRTEGAHPDHQGEKRKGRRASAGGAGEISTGNGRAGM